MTREEKIKYIIERGITYDNKTGKIYGVRGKEYSKHSSGYIQINTTMIYKGNKKGISIYAHQLIYYIEYNKLVDCIDHINGIRDDNRIDNLREVTNQQNSFNRHKAKGYYFNKRDNNFRAQIKLNRKTIYIGAYDNEIDARQAYLDAKKIYHII